MSLFKIQGFSGMSRYSLKIILLVFLVGVVVLYTMGYLNYKRALDKISAISKQEKNVARNVDMLDLYKFIITVAQKSGEKVIESLENHDNENSKMSKSKTLEGKDEWMTKGDLYSNAVMVNLFDQYYPGLKYVSEEKNTYPLKKNNLFVQNWLGGDYDRRYVNRSDILIWLDPLDATQEYTENLTKYVSTMICVAVKGVPLMGVVHFPFQQKTYSAYYNKFDIDGYLQIPPIKKDAWVPKNVTKIIISRSHSGEMEETLLSLFNKDKIEIIKAGGAGYKIIQLTERNADEYVHSTNIKKWDVCAGDAIMRAAGGRVLQRNGKLINYADDNKQIIEKGLNAALYKNFILI